MIEILNQAAERAKLHISFTPDGSAQLEPSTVDLDEALGRLLSIVYIAMVEGNWERLKACQNEDCRWVYYDISKNRSGSWCSMAMCGNRLKTSTYRRRKKEQLGEQEVPTSRRQNHAKKSTFHRQQQNR